MSGEYFRPPGEFRDEGIWLASPSLVNAASRPQPCETKSIRPAFASGCGRRAEAQPPSLIKPKQVTVFMVDRPA